MDRDGSEGRGAAGRQIRMEDLAAEREVVGEAVDAAALRVLRSGRFLLGPETAAFEAAMAAAVGVDFAVGVASGTQALELALRACGIGPGDEVLTTPFTFFATIEAVLLVGATPVFGDVEAGWFNLDPQTLDARTTARTRAVLPVHLFGRCADMGPIADFAAARDLPIVEDAAQAIGAARGGRPAGAWGAAAGFSFYPTKNLGAAGDAGCVTTDDPELADRLRRLRHHGQDSVGCHTLPGTNGRIDEIQAAILRAKLPYLKRWNDRRARHAARYAQLLSDCPDVVVQTVGPAEIPVWSQYTLRSPRAGALRRALAEAGVETRHYYPRPVYREPGFARALRPTEGLLRPEAERACAEAMSLPVHPWLPDGAVERVCEVIWAASTRR